MTQTIKERDYIFRARPRRTRPAVALMALGALSLVAATVSDTTAEEGEPPRMPEAVATPLVYGAVGGPERFVLETNGQGATIRFLCLPSEADCARPAPAALRERADGEARVLTDQAGRPVLTLAARGVRLHGGSAAVPDSVPAKGRAVLLTKARA